MDQNQNDGDIQGEENPVASDKKDEDTDQVCNDFGLEKNKL